MPAREGMSPRHAQVHAGLAAGQGIQRGHVNLTEHLYGDGIPPWSSGAGRAPFTSRLPTGRLDLTSPDEAYRRHVDRVLALARLRGILVIAFPAHLGHQFPRSPASADPW
jgi:hypothetical protein